MAQQREQQEPALKPYMNISLQLARPNSLDTAVIAQFKYDGKKRRLGLDVTVPSERWNKGKQRLKVLGSMHVNDRKDCEVLNTLLEAREALIHDVIHELTMDLGKAPRMGSIQGGMEAEVEREGPRIGVSPFLQSNGWMNSLRRLPNRTNGKGQRIHARTIQKYRTVQTQVDRFAKRHMGRPIDV